MQCVPRWLKLLYTGLVVVLAPIFAAHYGVTNFLWFSNVALLGTLVAIWAGSRLLLAMMAVAVVLPEIGWNVLFLARLLLGVEVLGLVAYMFDPGIPLWARLLSLYHVPLPFLLLWLVWRCGYDARALRWQTLLAWVLLPLSFLATTPRENVNWVYGPLDALGRPVVEPPIVLLLLAVGFPLLVYLPTHVVLRRWVGETGRKTARPAPRG